MAETRQRGQRGRDRLTIASSTRLEVVAPRPRAIFIGFNALGDTLCTTPTVRAYRRRHPQAHITYIAQHSAVARVLDGNPDIDVLVYSEFLARHGMSRFSVDWVYQQPLDFTQAATLYHFDMNQVCATKASFEAHIATGLSRLLTLPIDSVRPVVHVSVEERARAATLVRRPYAVLSLHSNANPMRPDGLGRVKDWPLDRVEAVCRHLRARGVADIVAVGSEFDERGQHPLWRNLYGLPIKVVAALLQDAALVVTLENGIGHLAHGVDAPMVMIYSNILPLGWANPVEAGCCEVLYDDPRRIPAAAVIAAADRVLHRADQRQRPAAARQGAR